MFFWLVIRLLYVSLKEAYSWLVFGVANLTLYLVFRFFFDLDSILSISILMVGFFIVPYIIVVVFMVTQYFYDIRRSPIKYWWFFFKPIRDYDLEIGFSNERQWLKDNLNRGDFLLFGEHVYFRNKDDAALFRLTIDG